MLIIIPLYSPKRSSQHFTKSSSPPFTEEEHAKYARRYEEGFDIVDDTRYNYWLDCFHPKSEEMSSSVCETKTPPRARASQLISVVSQYMPQLPQASASASIKSSGKVLTSAECLRALDEKEREKQQKIEEKEQRQRDKEREKQKKIEEKEQRQRDKEREKLKKIEEKEQRQREKEREKQQKMEEKEQRQREKQNAKKLLQQPRPRGTCRPTGGT